MLTPWSCHSRNTWMRISNCGGTRNQHQVHQKRCSPENYMELDSDREKIICQVLFRFSCDKSTRIQNVTPKSITPRQWNFPPWSIQNFPPHQRKCRKCLDLCNPSRPWQMKGTWTGHAVCFRPLGRGAEHQRVGTPCNAKKYYQAFKGRRHAETIKNIKNSCINVFLQCIRSAIVGKNRRDHNVSWSLYCVPEFQICTQATYPHRAWKVMCFHFWVVSANTSKWGKLIAVKDFKKASWSIIKLKSRSD